MKLAKSLMLGTAAGLLALTGAQAADLPVKAKAVEYVKICSLYGAGFYYIPGTDTCLRLGGALRLDSTFNSTIYNNPGISGALGLGTRDRDYYQSRARGNVFLDTRTATEYGVVRTFFNTQWQWTDSVDTIAGGNFETDYVFLQFAGFTFGKAVSMFDSQWVLAQPAVSSGLFGGSDNKTGLPLLAYTAQFGNGISGTVSIEDARPYRRGGIYDAADSIGFPGQGRYTNSEGGNHLPDFVANIRVDQAWGSFHVAGAAHNNTVSYNGANQLTGAPEDKWGYAVTAALEIKNLPTGVGDTFRIDGTVAEGASTYVFGGTQNIPRTGYSLFGSGSGVTDGGVGFGLYTDTVFSSAGAGVRQQLGRDYGARAFFEHFWTPQWRTSLYGTFARHEFNGTATALLLARMTAGFVTGAGAAAVANGSLLYGGGNLNFSVYQVGSRTVWTPITNLSFSAEVLYTRLDQNLNNSFVNVTNLGFKAPGLYAVRDQETVSGIVQVTRSF